MSEELEIPDKYAEGLEKLDKIAHGEPVELTMNTKGKGRSPFVSVRLDETSPVRRTNRLSTDDQLRLDRANAGANAGLKQVVKLEHQKSIFEK